MKVRVFLPLEKLICYIYICICEKHLEHTKLVYQIGSSSIDGKIIQVIGHKLVHIMS